MSTWFRPAILVCLGLAVVVSPAAAVKRRAFVTSIAGTGNLSTWPGAGGATGLAAGDNICRARAAAAGLPNASTYRAWLSTSTTDAYCHVQGLTGKKATGCGGGGQPGAGPWYLVDGTSQFTADLAALTAQRNEIYRPVLFDETGSYLADYANSRYWTGTTSLGEASPHLCGDWTSASSGAYGFFGSGFETAKEWSQDGLNYCNLPLRLLCLEPGASETTAQPWSPAALVFVTSATGTGDLASWPQSGGASGLAGGDAICRNLAAAAHLPAPQSFVAWLSTDAVDARDRLTLPVTTLFRRVDSYPVGSAHTLLLGLASGTIHVDEVGRYADGVYDSWTGTLGDGTVLSGQTCLGWTSSSAGGVGSEGRASAAMSSAWTDGSYDTCDWDSHLYCFANVVTIFWDGFDDTGDASRWSSVTP